MSIPTPFRITAEDLGDAKVGDAIAPLMDALNLSLNDIVSILTGGVGPDNLKLEVKSVTLAIDTLAESFPLRFSTKVVRPTWVGMVCNPKDPAHSLTTPFVMQGFSLTDSGQVSIPAITGVLAGNTYSLAFLVI